MWGRYWRKRFFCSGLVEKSGFCLRFVGCFPARPDQSVNACVEIGLGPKPLFFFSFDKVLVPFLPTNQFVSHSPEDSPAGAAPSAPSWEGWRVWDLRASTEWVWQTCLKRTKFQLYPRFLLQDVKSRALGALPVPPHTGDTRVEFCLGDSPGEQLSVYKGGSNLSVLAPPSSPLLSSKTGFTNQLAW